VYFLAGKADISGGWSRFPSGSKLTLKRASRENPESFQGLPERSRLERSHRADIISLLRRIIFVGQTALRLGFDIQGVGLRAV
jgi:hypothetical protein